MDHQITEEQGALLSINHEEKGPSPFSLFSQKREERGLTIQDVAFYLKVSHRQILDLEQSQFDQLPGNTFIRCLIRSYAQHLHIDPDQFLNYYEKNQPPYKNNSLSEPVVFISHTTPAFRQPKRFFLKCLTVIVLLNIAILLVHYQPHFSGQHLNILNNTAIKNNTNTPLSQASLLTLSNDISGENLQNTLFKKPQSIQNTNLSPHLTSTTHA